MQFDYDLLLIILFYAFIYTLVIQIMKFDYDTLLVNNDADDDD